MSKLIIALMLCLLALPCMAQQNAGYNLGFEQISNKTGLPRGWRYGSVTSATTPPDPGSAAYQVDSATAKSGKYALLIDWSKGYKDWTSAYYDIKGYFKGDKIKLTGYIKTENVTKGAGLWMRLDGEKRKNYGFDNMQSRPITGTTGWREYTIELDYDEANVKNIVVGGLIRGTGKMWIDDLHITIDGTDIANMPVYADAGKLGKGKYTTDDSLFIPVRDGARLSATMIRRAAATEPQPVILMYDIYPGKTNEAMAKYSAMNGYIGIVADTRGKRLGDGDIEPFEHDANDVYDIIDWISRQPWCNGKIGMYGGSYLGFAQWAAAKKVHPALKTIVPQVAVAPGIDFPTRSGINRGYSLRWLHDVTNNRLTDDDDFNDAIKWVDVSTRWFTSGKAFNTLDTLEGHPNKIFQRWLQHPLYDDYWNSMVPYKEEFAHINIPVLTISGYYDGDQRGAMYYFNQHQKYNANADDYLLIGPYDHFGAQRKPSHVIRGYTIDSVANIDIQKIVFQWFDHVLKDSAKPPIISDKINFEVMDANQWRHVPSLSQMNNDTLTFYLDNTFTDKGYKLRMQPNEGANMIEQEVDMARRDDTGDNLKSTFRNVAANDKHSRILRFVSDPINEKISINGSFIANLTTMINKKDMDIVVSMGELTPAGRFIMLSDNVARCSMVKDRTKRQLLTPGEKETLLIDNTFFISKQLSKGSRLVLLIGINKSKDFEVNYGTGKNVSTETINDAGDPLMVKWITADSYIKVPVFRE